MSPNNNKVSCNLLYQDEEEGVRREERGRRVVSNDTRARAARPHETASSRRGIDDSNAAEALHPTHPLHHPHHGTAVASTSTQATTIPGAVAVAGPGGARRDDGTVEYSVANEESQDPVPAHLVDTDEEHRVLSEQNRMLREQNRVLNRILLEREGIHPQQAAESVTMAQPVATNEGQQVDRVDNLEAQVPVANEDHIDENERGLKERVLDYLSSSKGCWRVAIGAVVVVVLIVAVIVPVILTQPSEPLTPGTLTPGESPTSPGATPTTPAPASSTPLQDLMELLSSVSPDGGEALSTPDTPQYQAVHWLADNTNLDSYSYDKKIQRYTLAVFYYSTKGDGWWNKGNWLDNGEECKRWWQYSPSTLQCTDSGDVVELDFSYNNLQGSIPPEIELLSKSLEILDVGWNAIAGTIPSHMIGTLTNLVGLGLGGNSLSGSIPSEIGLVTKLTALSLGPNQFSSGTIPNAFASLTNLEFLSLYDSHLTGTIPSFLESMTKLEFLYLHNNQFSGNFTCPDYIDCCAITCNDCTACRYL